MIKDNNLRKQFIIMFESLVERLGEHDFKDEEINGDVRLIEDLCGRFIEKRKGVKGNGTNS